MTRVLIATHTGDIHATAVARAIEDKGHQAVLWHERDYPTQQVGSLSIMPKGPLTIHMAGPGLDLSGDFGAIWVRRSGGPVLPEDMHAGDRIVAKRECTSFLGSIWRAFERNALWVNPLDSGRVACCKTVQLREAVQVGLAIPPTLYSNDPQAIRDFVSSCEGEAIFKLHHPAIWKTQDGTASTLTSVVSMEDLEDDDSLSLCPGFFQPRITKAYELRVTVIGQQLFAIKLHSQEDPTMALDWRPQAREMRMSPFQLPPEIERRCRALMDRLGLVFGCMDFIVTPEGEYVFLEVNEMGQFLWVEQQVPELRLLDAFCELLIQGRPDFRWRSDGPDQLEFADYLDLDAARALDAHHITMTANPFAVTDDPQSATGRV